MRDRWECIYKRLNSKGFGNENHSLASCDTKMHYVTISKKKKRKRKKRKEVLSKCKACPCSQLYRTEATLQ